MTTYTVTPSKLVHKYARDIETTGRPLAGDPSPAIAQDLEDAVARPEPKENESQF